MLQADVGFSAALRYCWRRRDDCAPVDQVWRFARISPDECFAGSQLSVGRPRAATRMSRSLGLAYFNAACARRLLRQRSAGLSSSVRELCGQRCCGLDFRLGVAAAALPQASCE